jgi:SAM-dependent methyltransferase
LWTSGENYERYVGRWSRPVAAEFLGWIAAPANVRWLDIGCGSGALSSTIITLANPAALTGVDPSDGFLRLARAQVTDPRAEFMAGSAQAIPLPDGSVDVVVGGLMLNFVPPGEQPAALAEMRRVCRPGGSVAVYVWDYSGGMQMMRYFWDVAAQLDPGVQDLVEGLRFPICRPEPLTDLWTSAGLGGVETRSIDVPTTFSDFDDYWTPFLGGQGPGPTYVASLDEVQRDRLRDRIRERLPIAPDGSIHLTARAWAVRGITP